MENVLDFIVNNWKWLTCVLIATIELLVVIFRKRVKVVDTIREYILQVLPYVIRVAEAHVYGSDKKKDFVIGSVCDLLTTRYGNIDVFKYVEFIRDSLESILSTPQKKERS